MVYFARPRRQRYWLHIALFVATIVSTLVVGARMQFNFISGHPPLYTGEGSLDIFPLVWAFHAGHIWMGLPFSGALMLILFAHEMGHYLYCVRYRVAATLPFFIPFPTLIGTLGAFIRIRSPIRSRSQLFDIGIAGPIAGFAVALPILIFALTLSKPLSSGAQVDEIQLGFPLIFHIVHALWGAFVPSRELWRYPLSAQILHPVAVAAWVGMFATSLNLLPGGQLDGGHIVFALAPRRHKQVSRMLVIALIPMALYFSISWLLWAVVVRVTLMRHPMVPEWPGVGTKRKYLGVLALVMLALTLTPSPFAHNSGAEILQQLRSSR